MRPIPKAARIPAVIGLAVISFIETQIISNIIILKSGVGLVLINKSIDNNY